MNRLAICMFCAITILLVSACTENADKLAYSKYQVLSWIDLTPDDESLADPESELESLEMVDDLYADDYVSVAGLQGGRPVPRNYESDVVAEIDGKSVRLPGFIVPVEFNANNLVTEFFFVPDFGACVHLPASSPNQTIYVTAAEPIRYENIYEPAWIMGVIKIEQTDNDIAEAAYSMDLERLEPFTE